MITVKFYPSRITKNTVMFTEEGEVENRMIGTLYVTKKALRDQLGLDFSGVQSIEDMAASLSSRLVLTLEPVEAKTVDP